MEPQITRRRAALLLGALVLAPSALRGESAADLDAAADRALQRLIETQPVGEDMIRKARGLLIFPEIVKGGLLIGGSTGRGVLRVDGRNRGYYRSTAVSYGLQAGFAKFGYIMFLMDDAALKFVESTDGWEVGAGPNITIADQGVASRLSTTTAQSGIYVFFVDQSGYFAGVGLEGSKISRIAD